MEATGNDLNVFAVSGGDPPQNWAPGPHAGLHRRHQGRPSPDATFINDESTALATTYDPATTYDAYTALLQGNPELQFIENVDIGAEHADRAIVDAGREGQVFTIGWNVSEAQLDAVEQGIQVAALDQKWGDQAAFGAVACADFLQNGVIRPNTQVLFPVTQENLEAGSRGVPSRSPAADKPFRDPSEPGDRATPVARLDPSPTPRQPGERRMTSSSATPPAAAPATRSGGRVWAGRAWEAGLRVGGLAFAIVLVIVVFTLVSKPNTFLTLTNALVITRGMSTDRHRRSRPPAGHRRRRDRPLVRLHCTGSRPSLISVAGSSGAGRSGPAICSPSARRSSSASINAVLVTGLKIPSFIVTFGTGQLIFGLTLFVTNTQTLNPAYPPTGIRCRSRRSTSSSGSRTRTCRSASRCRACG